MILKGDSLRDLRGDKSIGLNLDWVTRIADLKLDCLVCCFGESDDLLLELETSIDFECDFSS